MSEQQQRKENILSEAKLRLYAPACPGSDKAPVLIPDIFENNPRLRVRTNVQNDANKGYIEAAMNSRVFAKLCEGIRQLARNELKDDNGQPLPGFRVENYGHPFMNGMRSKEKRVVSITSVIKDDKGVIRISITAGKTRPIIDFVFLEDDYHYFKDANGNAMSERASSALAAISWANMMEKYMAIALTEYVTPAWVLKRQAQQAGGGGYQGQQGGYQQRQQGGGYQQQGYTAQPQSQPSNMDSFDIDIPI